ncbi:MAG TPA: hypothetical protein PK379_07655 [Candidatus Hydrogenedentes bacterium]|nr:hypothetical protein [Candidatus Hydrogenedentota bacterium]HOJ69213.1 hypothetical protein [Candidatus Hydrogenedentota bacterium]HOK89888.1 hypothetical protein [Candidatus Hydrogenedentota bacterium]
MGADILQARLNLEVVLGLLAEVANTDPLFRERSRTWRETTWFKALGGPEGWIRFSPDGASHGIGKPEGVTIGLVLLSAIHLNRMFRNEGLPPVPVKGIGRLSFLKKEFTELGTRLQTLTRPGITLRSKEEEHLSTRLMLNAAVRAVPVLAEEEGTCAKLAAATPEGVLEIATLDGAFSGWIRKEGGRFTAGLGKPERVTARMLFRDLDAARIVLTGKETGFAAIGLGLTRIEGLIPLVDNVSLIMDRLERYLA